MSILNQRKSQHNLRSQPVYFDDNDAEIAREQRSQPIRESTLALFANAKRATEVAKRAAKVEEQQPKQSRELFRGRMHEEALLAAIPNLFRIQGRKSYRFEWGSMKGAARVKLNGDGFLELALEYRDRQRNLTTYSVELPRAYAIALGLPKNKRGEFSPSTLRWSRRDMLDHSGLLPFKRIPRVEAPTKEVIEVLRRPLRLALLEAMARQLAAELPSWHRERNRDQVAVRFTLDWAVRVVAFPKELARRTVGAKKRLLAQARQDLLKVGLIQESSKSKKWKRYAITPLKAGKPGITLDQLRALVQE